MNSITRYITHSTDTALLLAEVAQVAPQFIITDEAGVQSIGPLAKTPTIRNGLETVAVCQELPIELQGLQHLTVLGSFPVNSQGIVGGNTQANNPITWATPNAQTTYERVAQRPATTTLPDGSSYEEPYIRCVF